MQYLDALEGLRSQGFPNEEVAVRQFEIIQRFFDGVLNFELKRNLAFMYAQEKYVEEPPTVDALRFAVQQYLRMRDSARTDHYGAALQETSSSAKSTKSSSITALLRRNLTHNGYIRSLWLIDNNSLALQCMDKPNRHRHISVPEGPPIPQTCFKACEIDNLALILRKTRLENRRFSETEVMG